MESNSNGFLNGFQWIGIPNILTTPSWLQWIQMTHPKLHMVSMERTSYIKVPIMNITSTYSYVQMPKKHTKIYIYMYIYIYMIYTFIYIPLIRWPFTIQILSHPIIFARQRLRFASRPSPIGFASKLLGRLLRRSAAPAHRNGVKRRWNGDETSKRVSSGVKMAGKSMKIL